MKVLEAMLPEYFKMDVSYCISCCIEVILNFLFVKSVFMYPSPIWHHRWEVHYEGQGWQSLVSHKLNETCRHGPSIKKTKEKKKKMSPILFVYLFFYQHYMYNNN